MQTSDIAFDPAKYYASYPARIILRPGYPARASYKSTLLFHYFGEYVLSELGEIKDYADIGGCFGFGANAMAFHISQQQGFYPNTSVFEISPEFVATGKLLFPYINFVDGRIECVDGDSKAFDLVTLFDVVEHISSPGVFLKALSRRTKFVLLKTPMETSGEWRGSRPPARQGNDHAGGT
ncbi:MAG: methyltransferase domain-containing protein [Planctomycetota bacterium]